MSDDTSGKGSSPKDRLEQISNHIGTSEASKKKARRKKSASGPPADWSDTLSQLETLKNISQTPPTDNPGYIRQKKAGKLWVRERIAALLDPDSFHELGAATGTIEWAPAKDERASGTGEEVKSFTPSNNVQGSGLINGRKVLVTADDFSLRAGHADGYSAAKSLHAEMLCLELRIPIIKLVDGSSGGGSVTTLRKWGYSYVPPMIGWRYIAQQLDLGIPNAAAILGPAIGLGAARATACHFSAMAGSVGALFNAGPKVVAKASFEEGLTARELGGAEVHCANGTVDNYAEDEKDVFELVRRFLSYVPNCGHTSLPPTADVDDPKDRDASALRTLIPRRRARTYSMHRLITTAVDRDSFFEIGPLWGRTAILGLARVGGRPCGVIANNPEALSGAIDAASAQKMARHLNLCDVFNLPVVQFVDCPGYAVGTAAERAATMRWGVELGKAYLGTTVPVFNVLVRKCYGVAGGLMVDCREVKRVVAWPSLEAGSLPLEGGIEASHSRELREAGEDKQKVYDELLKDYLRLQNPVRTAAAFDVEEIIDPSDTRKVLWDWVEHMYNVKLPERVTERQMGKIRPVFR